MTTQIVTKQTIRNEQTAEQRERQSARRLHPVLLAALASQPALAENPKPLKGSDGNALPMDLVHNAECHPDVVLLRKAIPTLSVETATKMAWVLWRARQLTFWSRDLSKDTYAQETLESGETRTVFLHKGADRITWQQALDHADQRTEWSETIMARRKEFYAKQESRREEEEAIALTLRGTDGIVIPAGGSIPMGGGTAQDRAQLQADLQGQQQAGSVRIRKGKKK